MWPSAEGRGSGAISEPADSAFQAAAAQFQTCFSDPELDRCLIHFRSPHRSRNVRTCSLTEIETGFGSIFCPGTALGRSRDASGGRSGLPGAGKRAGSSGLQRIAWIIPKTHGSGPVAQNGLGAGAGAGLTELSNQRAPIFRVRRPRPSSCGAAANKYSGLRSYSSLRSSE